MTRNRCILFLQADLGQETVERYAFILNDKNDGLDLIEQVEYDNDLDFDYWMFNFD